MSQTKAELIDGKGDVVFDTDTLAVDATNNRVGIGEAAPGTQVEVNGAEPYITIKNSTEEDTDGGRESKIIFEGEQSGGEISTLGQIEVSHDGAVDDQKGKIVISTNDGDDGAAPTARVIIDADGNVGIGTTDPGRKLEVNSGDSDVVINSVSTDSGAYISFEDNATTGDTYVRVGAVGDDLRLDSGNAEAGRFNSNGELLVGSSSSVDVGSVSTANLQVTQNNAGIPAAFYSLADATGPGGVIALGHGRSTASGILSSGDVIGQIRFAGADGTDMVTLGAQISAEVDGTPGTDDMPGRLVFSTTADSASSPTERMRIASDGRFTTNGMTQIFDRGSTNGSSSFTRDFTLNYPDTAIITCAFSHYGLFTYGCSRITFVGFGPAFSPNTVHNHTTSNSGSWDISRVSNNTIRVTKNAGSNGGSGLFFIHVFGT